MHTHFPSRGGRLAWLVPSICLAALGAAPGAEAGTLPKISKVVFTGSAEKYTATISGTNFGPVPEGIPCKACTPVAVSVVDLATNPQAQTINVTSWSNTQVTVTGIGIPAGDALRVNIYNQTVGNVAAWGGRVSHAGGVPKITGIAATVHGRKSSFTITGSGFGAAPPQVGQNTTSPFLVLTDFNPHSVGGDGFPWNAAFCGTNDCNLVTAGYTSWNDTSIVMTTYGSEYGGGAGGWQVHKHDAFCVGVWPSTSQTGGTAGGTVKCTRLP